MKVLAPAKINLHLEILGKRADGYHEIRTLMHRVDLCDEMEISVEGQGIKIIAEGEGIPEGREAGFAPNIQGAAFHRPCRSTEAVGCVGQGSG